MPTLYKKVILKYIKMQLYGRCKSEKSQRMKVEILLRWLSLYLK